MRSRPTASDRLTNPDALLTRSDLAKLGLERRAVDCVFREIAREHGTIMLSGYSRPMIRVEHCVDLLERSTYRGDRVRPVAGGIT